tara:strand:+ start:298 stop:768 length:471 start_codon:yes stop_codon:yes gene_type:complete
MGINTILRVSDLLRLRVCDLIHQNGDFREYLSLKEQKTGNLRKIKINSLIRTEVGKYILHYDLEDENYLFFSLRSPDRPLDRVTAYKRLTKSATEVGIEHFGTHSMRKTLAYQVYIKSKDIALVMNMLNHKNPQTTLKYIGIHQAEMDKAYEDFSL